MGVAESLIHGMTNTLVTMKVVHPTQGAICTTTNTGASSSEYIHGFEIIHYNLVTNMMIDGMNSSKLLAYLLHQCFGVKVKVSRNKIGGATSSLKDQIRRIKDKDNVSSS